MFIAMHQIDKTTRQLLRDPLKRRAWVIYQLQISGRSLASVARDAGVKRQCIYHGLVKPYPRMEKLIASALGFEPQALFPERYTAEGLPNRPMGRRPDVSCHAHTGKHRRAAGKRNTQATASA